MAKYCTNCGSKLKDDSKICAMCNHVVEDAYDETADKTVEKRGFINKFANKINELAGGKSTINLRVRDLFRDVFKKHTTDDANEIFTCGTKLSTPKDNEISANWPKPWLYTRVFLMFAVTFFLLQICISQFGNINVLPGMMFIGAIMVPFSLLIFFLEVNAPRNISFFEIIKIFFVGGCASLVSTLTLFTFFPEGRNQYLNAIVTGIVEELGKFAIIAFYISRKRNLKYSLNGLLIGAAVGAGFATFETAGYIFRYAVKYGYSAMMDTIFVRAFLAPGGHVAWAAINGAAFMLVKKNRAFDFSQVFEKRFLTFFAITAAMHAIWDMPIPLGQQFFLIPILLTVVAWIIILVLIQVGLNQIVNNDFNSYASY